MESVFGANVWCDLDSLRFIVERNPGSIVILVAIVGFLFYRLKKFIADGLYHILMIAPLGKKTKAAVSRCYQKRESEREACVIAVAEDRFKKGIQRISWIFELFLNLVALALLIVGICVCYLVMSPPVSCAVPGESGIYVPSVFKKISDKGGEILYSDETNRSYVRIWPGVDSLDEAGNATIKDLMDRYERKKFEALKNASSKAFDIEARPVSGRNYFVVSWRDRDNFDVYFVSRLMVRTNGKAYIDSLEISSPVHGNALMGLDYKMLFCSFVKPSATDLPSECRHL